jgi:hypothetical protein
MQNCPITVVIFLSHKVILDILKLATSREIANDAMALSLLIKDNTQLDTGDLAMKKFADIELLIFQNKKIEAYSDLETLKSENPDHPLIDEILFKQAELKMEMGDFYNFDKYAAKHCR